MAKKQLQPSPFPSPKPTPSSRQNTVLRAYLGWLGDDPNDSGCILVFAFNAKQARAVAYRYLASDGDFIDTRVRRLTDNEEYLLTLQTSSLQGTPHVVDDPPYCCKCGRWGSPLKIVNGDDMCISCVTQLIHAAFEQLESARKSNDESLTRKA